METADAVISTLKWMSQDCRSLQYSVHYVDGTMQYMEQNDYQHYPVREMLLDEKFQELLISGYGGKFQRKFIRDDDGKFILEEVS